MHILALALLPRIENCQFPAPTLRGKSVLTGKRPKIRPMAFHAFPDTAFFTTKSTKNTKKEKLIRFSS